jgi:hypothetical protein
MADTFDLDDDSLQEDDGIIELTNGVADKPDNEDDGFIKLTEMVDDINSDKEEMLIELTHAVDAESVTGTFGSPEELDIDDQEIRESLTAEDVSPDQVRSALEKIIEEKFGDTLEPMLFKVMEEVLKREISTIRDRFQEELDKIGKA